jgi:hypothetical protein
MSRSDDIVRLRQCGRKFVAAAIPLLEAQRNQASIDLYEPIADEVMGGLFARTFRLLHAIMLDLHLWSVDLSRVILRMMRESVFYMGFLSKQNTPEAFLNVTVGRATYTGTLAASCVTGAAGYTATTPR